MQGNIEAFKRHVKEASTNPGFVHHKWFVKWHLEIVERLALELCDHYPQADRELVEVMVWLHDYGKILDFDHEYEMSDESRKKLTEIDFSSDFADRAVGFVEIMDKKLEVDLRETPIEVQIVSTADGCSHLAGPFMHVFWNEATDKTFTNMTFEELMKENRRKADVDWSRKIVLPEARRTFEQRYKFLCEQTGDLPAKFF